MESKKRNWNGNWKENSKTFNSKKSKKYKILVNIFLINFYFIIQIFSKKPSNIFKNRQKYRKKTKLDKIYKLCYNMKGLQKTTTIFTKTKLFQIFFQALKLHNFYVYQTFSKITRFSHKFNFGVQRIF